MDDRHRQAPIIIARRAGLPCRFNCGRSWRPDDSASMPALLRAAAARDAHELAEHGDVYSTARTTDARRHRATRVGRAL